ncbi:tetratricopeptide repeat protein [Sphingobacterium siyangense]|uniref:tetratricopeptide repeat protein n=1 Tax=Sphingobacterium siyangense TaxID=459529 RepID=UPI003DA68BF6
MNKKVTLLIFGLTLVFNQVFGQTFKQQFNEFVSKKDTLGQQQLLDKWEKSDSNDPELYIAYFNYFVKKSVKEVVTLGQNPKGNDVLQIMDKDSSKKEPVAYLYGDTYYDQNILKKGFDYIDKGLSKYPNRLDMRFGKIYLLGQIENYEKFTAEIINTIDYSHVNKNKWTWADNKPLGDPENFMLSSIQDYQLQLYNTENDNLIENMKRIAEAVLKYYPEHIESLSNISIVFMLQKQYDKALDTLLKAEKLNLKDCIVLNNIAQTYKLKGDTINAITKCGTRQLTGHSLSFPAIQL